MRSFKHEMIIARFDNDKVATAVIQSQSIIHFVSIALILYTEPPCCQVDEYLDKPV